MKPRTLKQIAADIQSNANAAWNQTIAWDTFTARARKLWSEVQDGPYGARRTAMVQQYLRAMK